MSLLDSFLSMASSSNTFAYPRAQVVLPSIHDILPGHLAPIPYLDYRLPMAPPPMQNHSFDALPRNSLRSSAHISSWSVGPPRPMFTYSFPRTSRAGHPAPESSGSSKGDADVRYEAQDFGSGREAGKKYRCGTCGKRFNRPSSLRIHVNTHTGATRKHLLPPTSSISAGDLVLLIRLSLAFQCPYPSCGREFNVNSNMRRHYRNHDSTSSRSSVAASPSPQAPVEFEAQERFPSSNPWPVSVGSELHGDGYYQPERAGGSGKRGIKLI